MAEIQTTKTWMLGMSVEEVCIKSQQDMWSTERNDPGQMVHNISPSPGFPLEIARVPFPLLNKPTIWGEVTGSGS